MGYYMDGDKKLTFSDYKIFRHFIHDVEVRRLIRAKMKTNEVFLQKNLLIRIDAVPCVAKNKHFKLTQLTDKK